MKKLNESEQLALVQELINGSQKAKETMLVHPPFFGKKAESKLIQAFLRHTEDLKDVLAVYAREYSFFEETELQLVKALKGKTIDVKDVLLSYFQVRSLCDEDKIDLIMSVMSNPKNAEEVLTTHIKQDDLLNNEVKTKLLAPLDSNAADVKEVLILSLHTIMCDEANDELINLLEQGAPHAKEVWLAYFKAAQLDAKTDVKLVKALRKNPEDVKEVLLAYFEEQSLWDKAEIELINLLADGLSEAKELLLFYVKVNKGQFNSKDNARKELEILASNGSADAEEILAVLQ